MSTCRCLIHGRNRPLRSSGSSPKSKRPISASSAFNLYALDRLLLSAADGAKFSPRANSRSARRRREFRRRVHARHLLSQALADDRRRTRIGANGVPSHEVAAGVRALRSEIRSIRVQQSGCGPNQAEVLEKRKDALHRWRIKSRGPLPTSTNGSGSSSRSTRRLSTASPAKQSCGSTVQSTSSTLPFRIRSPDQESVRDSIRLR